MRDELKKLPKAQVEIEIEISADEFEGYFEKAEESLSQNLNFKGFRKGKIPKEILRREIGEERIIARAEELAVEASYKKALERRAIEPISRPEIDILKSAKGNPFLFRARFSVLPEIKLPDYKKIASRERKNKVSVEEKEIEDSLRWLQKSRAKFSLKQGSAQKRDFVEIEYWSEETGDMAKPQKDGFILGEGRLLPELEEKLIGMRTGEEKRGIVLDVPQSHFMANMAGRKLLLNVKITSLQKVELPELTDEFARNMGDFDSLENLKNNVSEGILKEKEKAESARLRDEILRKISEAFECDIPDVLAQRERQIMLEEFKNNVTENLKMSFADYLAEVKKTENEIAASLLPKAQKRVKDLLILREIGRKENIEVTEQELAEESGKILKYYAGIREAKKEIDPERLKEYTKEALTREKIFQFLEGLARSQ